MHVPALGLLLLTLVTSLLIDDWDDGTAGNNSNQGDTGSAYMHSFTAVGGELSMQSNVSIAYWYSTIYPGRQCLAHELYEFVRVDITLPPDAASVKMLIDYSDTECINLNKSKSVPLTDFIAANNTRQVLTIPVTRFNLSTGQGLLALVLVDFASARMTQPLLLDNLELIEFPPTPAPTASPTSAPTPTLTPTLTPTTNPTSSPTPSPTSVPSVAPTPLPTTSVPSVAPTPLPTTSVPSVAPTPLPTALPADPGSCESIATSSEGVTTVCGVTNVDDTDSNTISDPATDPVTGDEVTVLSPHVEITVPGGLPPNSSIEFFIPLADPILDTVSADARAGKRTCVDGEEYVVVVRCEWLFRNSTTATNDTNDTNNTNNNTGTQSDRWRSDGCVTSSAPSTSLSSNPSSGGRWCNCTHLTVFALIARRLKATTPSACPLPATGVSLRDHVFTALYAVVGLLALVQGVRVTPCLRIGDSRTDSRPSDRLLLTHGAIATVCLLVSLRLQLAPWLSIAGLCLLASVPQFIEFAVLGQLILGWASLSLFTLEANPFSKMRVPYYVVGIVLFLGSLGLPLGVWLVAREDEVGASLLARWTARVLAAMMIAACVGTCLFGLLLAKEVRLGGSNTNRSNASVARKIERKILFTTCSLCVCFIVLSALNVVSVQEGLADAASSVMTSIYLAAELIALITLSLVFFDGINSHSRCGVCRQGKDKSHMQMVSMSSAGTT